VEFIELQDKIFGLYGQQRLDDALQTLQKHEAKFPEHAWGMAYWKLCFQAALGKYEAANVTLAAALDNGYWFAENALRTDDDLFNMQPDAEYQALVKRSAALQSEAQRAVHPTQILMEPLIGTPPYSTVIALHGNNATAESVAKYYNLLPEAGILLAAPQSEQLGSRPDAFVWDDYDEALRVITTHFDELLRSHAVNPARVVLSGFSMGGQVAIRLALEGRVPVAGVLAVAPWMGLDETLGYLPPAPPEGSRLRMVILVGEGDKSALNGCARLIERLNQYGIEHQFLIYPNLSHSFPPDFEVVLSRFLSFILDP